MAFKDILIHVDGSEATASRIAYAVALAAEKGANLLCVAFAPTTLLPLYGAPDVGFTAVGDVLEGVKAQAEAAIAACKERAGRAGVSVDARLVQGVPDEFPHAFALCARHADLALVGQPRNNDPLIGQYALVERCLFASGRPVLVHPAGYAEPPKPETVVAAWDGSAEAARAFSDALDFLAAASRVVLLVGETAQTSENGKVLGADMFAHLSRHEVPVELMRVPVDENGVGKVLLAKAGALGADMIVMGAFHHSRWREFILGGVTLTILEQATVPLFMAH